MPLLRPHFAGLLAFAQFHAYPSSPLPVAASGSHSCGGLLHCGRCEHSSGTCDGLRVHQLPEEALLLCRSKKGGKGGGGDDEEEEADDDEE